MEALHQLENSDAQQESSCRHELAPEAAHAEHALAFGEVGEPWKKERYPFRVLRISREISAQERLLAADRPWIVNGEGEGEDSGNAQHFGAEGKPHAADKGEEIERMPAQRVRPHGDEHPLLLAADIGEAPEAAAEAHDREEETTTKSMSSKRVVPSQKLEPKTTRESMPSPKIRLSSSR